jgi:enterochelin esterase-like enzyme
MRSSRLSLALVFQALLPAIICAQQPASPWLKEAFKSAKLGVDRTIYVATPANYSTSGQRYPVLVLLDAED